MVVRFALAPWTALLTLATGVRLLGSRCAAWGPHVLVQRRVQSPAASVALDPQHAAHAAAVAGGDLDTTAEPALHAWGLLLEDVVQLGLPAEQLPVLGHPEAACGTAVGLHRRHGGRSSRWSVWVVRLVVGLGGAAQWSVWVVRLVVGFGWCGRYEAGTGATRPPVWSAGEFERAGCDPPPSAGATPRPAAPRSAVGSALATPEPLRGENTAIMLRPSCLAGLSTWAISVMSVASRSSRRRPSSVWAISRPRNMIVTLTLWPCLRNRSTWPFLVS